MFYLIMELLKRTIYCYFRGTILTYSTYYRVILLLFCLFVYVFHIIAFDRFTVGSTVIHPELILSL